ncbi:MAG: hypothetical protein ABSE59_01500 [Opitutaceae bacterium]|jgi:hypothetical protein
MKIPGILSVLCVMLGVGCLRADNIRDVNVYSYVTPAGAKLTRPTADRPANYYLINGGLHEEGSVMAGEKPPAPDRVDALVHKALTAAHYIDIHYQQNPKELDYIIVYYWGTMNPKIVDADEGDDNDADVTPTVSFNGASMLALVAGDSLDRMTPNTQTWDETLAAAEQNRYFVFIAAYSPAAYFKDNKRELKLLWRAQMSLPSDGVTFDESIDALVTSSVSYLGRPTDLPQQVFLDLDRNAHVDVGAPVVKEYLPPSKLGPADTNQPTSKPGNSAPTPQTPPNGQQKP